MPAPARNRGHRLAAYPRCWADLGYNNGGMRSLMVAGKLDGVAVRIHWTLIAGSGALFLVSWPHIVEPLCAILAYFAAMLVHEWGHAYMARRRRCRVYGIELYPFVGLTRHALPYSRSDHAAIAWGGVTAQAVFGLPVLGWILTVGYTRFEPANAFLAIFGWLCLFMILLNLIPIPPLDGALAWSGLPALPRLARALRFRRRKKLRGWNALK
jgi:stage IV sporulation protein FB